MSHYRRSIIRAHGRYWACEEPGQFLQAVKVGPVLIESFMRDSSFVAKDLPTGMYGTIDIGAPNPSAFEVERFVPDGTVVIDLVLRDGDDPDDISRPYTLRELEVRDPMPYRKPKPSTL